MSMTMRDLKEWVESELESRPNLYEGSDDPCRDYDALVTIMQWIQDAEDEKSSPIQSLKGGGVQNDRTKFQQ